MNYHKKIEQKQTIKKPVYIQSITRKPYSNRFIKELIDLIEEYKQPNESRTHFIEDAIIDKLRKAGCEFRKPMTEQEQKEWEEEIKNWQ